jgi:hypothetical protein
MYLQKVISRKTLKTISFLLASSRSRTKIEGSGSGFIGYKNGMDPQHCSDVLLWCWIPIPTTSEQDYQSDLLCFHSINIRQCMVLKAILAKDMPKIIKKDGKICLKL